jgi:hypothetical protein
MLRKSFCRAQIAEKERLLALCAPGVEREALMRAAGHWRALLHLAELPPL